MEKKLAAIPWRRDCGAMQPLLSAKLSFYTKLGNELMMHNHGQQEHDKGGKLVRRMSNIVAQTRVFGV